MNVIILKFSKFSLFPNKISGKSLFKPSIVRAKQNVLSLVPETCTMMFEKLEKLNNLVTYKQNTTKLDLSNLTSGFM